MFCPKCGAEYRDGFFECADCHVQLVWELPPEPEKKSEPEKKPVEPVTVVEVKNLVHLTLVESILEEAGIPFVVMGMISDNVVLANQVDAEVQVGREDEQEAKRLLAELDDRNHDNVDDSEEKMLNEVFPSSKQEGCVNQSNHYPSISQAISLLVLVFFLMIMLSISVGILEVIVDFPFTKHPATLAVVNLIAIGLILMWGLKKVKASFKNVFSLVPIRISLFLPISLTIIGVGILLSELDNLLRTVLPMPAGIADFYAKLLLGQTSLWGSFVVLVVVAPLTEELLFRGFILRGFLSHYSRRKAVLASAILFGAFHLNPWQFLEATILGVLFAWLFVRTRSLLPCIYGHALINALPIILLGILNLEIPGVTSELTKVEFQPLWLDLFGLFLAGLGLWLLKRMFGKEDDNPPEDLLRTHS
jgi:membrane protease YdiL (CAAX protease family)